MYRSILAATLVLFIAACGDDGTGPGDEGDPLANPALYEGLWRVELDDTGCTPDYDEAILWVDIQDDLTALSSGTINVTTSRWARSQTFSSSWAVTGSFKPQDRTFELNLFFTGGSDQRIQLTGGINAGPTLSGVWTDTDINYLGGCSGTFTAMKA